MNLFGHKTNVWLGLQGDDYMKMRTEKSEAYSNWSPVEVIHVSLDMGFVDMSSCLSVNRNHNFQNNRISTSSHFVLVIVNCRNSFTSKSKHGQNAAV